MTLIIPERLAATCRATPERRAWLEQLPDAIGELQDWWSLSLAVPFDGTEVSCAWVAPAVRSDGSRAILKLGMPHMEGEHEIQALRFWDGNQPCACSKPMTPSMRCCWSAANLEPCFASCPSRNRMS
ncbi:MAG TPA: hypothetical protein VKE41_18965 [Roseiflexaceae bacterium]|nr:hypothetical protein [Roseiflexaceae bacterium]